MSNLPGNNQTAQNWKKLLWQPTLFVQVVWKKYTPEPTLNGYSADIRKKAILMSLNGQTFRSIARQLDINPQTVANWVNFFVTQSTRSVYKHPKNR